MELMISMGMVVGSLATVALFQGFQNQTKKDLMHEVAKIELLNDIRVSLLSVNNCLCNFQGKVSYNSVKIASSSGGAPPISIDDFSMSECEPSGYKVSANSTHKSSGFGSIYIQNQRLEHLDVLGDSQIIADYYIEAKRDAAAIDFKILKIPMTFRFDDTNKLISCSTNSGGLRTMKVQTVSNSVNNKTYHYFGDILKANQSCRLKGRPLTSIVSQPVSISAPPTVFTYGAPLTGTSADIYSRLSDHIGALDDPPTKSCSVAGGQKVCRTESLYLGGLSGVEITSIPPSDGLHAQIFKNVVEVTRDLATGTVKKESFFESLSGGKKFPKKKSTDALGRPIEAPEVELKLSDFNPNNGIPDGTTVGDVKCVKGWWRKL